MTTGDPATAKARSKKEWQPTPEAFRQLLAWLDGGTESNGERYLEMRRRLVGYFRRKDSLSPDDLADDVLNRVARRLEEAGTISEGPPERYCYIVAKFVFLESLRNPDRLRTDLVPEALAAPPKVDDERLERLDRCLEQLTAADRHLILDYYRGDQRARIEQRKVLAAQLATTPNALALRASRLRARLEQCVGAGLSTSDTVPRFSSHKG
jgi:DNA-directed RNA polymerase specialized sigma24 family protein